MSCLCGDKHDKCIISKLNIYGQNSRKGKARTTAQEQSTEEQAGPMLWVHPDTASMCHHTALSLFHSSVSTSPTTSGCYSWISSSQQAGAISRRQRETLWPLEVEQTCGCAASFPGGMGGLRAPLSVGTVLRNPMHSLTRGQTAAPKGVVQSWSLEIVSFSLVHGCELMRFMHSAGIFIDWESTRRYWRTGVNKASKPGTCKILYN